MSIILRRIPELDCLEGGGDCVPSPLSYSVMLILYCTPTSRILRKMELMANKHDKIWKRGGPQSPPLPTAIDTEQISNLQECVKRTVYMLLQLRHLLVYEVLWRKLIYDRALVSD